MKLVKPGDLFRYLLKNKRGRLLGLDVGHKYVGLSVSDPGNVIALPLSVLVRQYHNKTNIDLMAEDFKTLVRKLPLAGFVVGLPFPMERSKGTEAALVRCFIDDICGTGKLKDMNYTYWDENFTSKCVEALLSSLDLHPVESKTILDKFAAVGILQGYLDCMRRQMTKADEEELVPVKKH